MKIISNLAVASGIVTIVLPFASFIHDASDTHLAKIISNSIKAVSFIFVATYFAASYIIERPDAPNIARKDEQKPRYRDLYNRTLDKVLHWTWKHAGIDEPAGTESAWQLFNSALTHKLLYRSILIAFIYPILLILLPNALFKSEVRLGAIILLPRPVSWANGALSILPVFAFFIVYLSLRWLRSQSKRSSRTFLIGIRSEVRIRLFAIGIAIAIASLLTIAKSNGGTGLTAFSYMISVVLLFSFAGVGAFAGAFALAEVVPPFRTVLQLF